MPIQDRSYYRDDYGQEPRGPLSMVVKLIIVNVAIFAIDAFTSEHPFGGNWLSWMMSLKTDGEGVFVGKGVPFWQLPFWNVWQVFTYGFAHASISTTSSIFHLGFNMVGLFFLGRAVESELGSQEFLKFYLLSLFFAGAFSYFYNYATGQSAMLVGASGAVTAVIILFVLRNPHQTLLIWGVIPVPAWLIGIIIIVGDVITSLSADTHIGWYAHLSGAFFAFLYFKLRWNFNWIKLEWITDRFSGKPRLKVHRASAAVETLKSQADQVLEKLHLEGESSLSRKERKILEKYSRKVREERD